MKRLGVFTAVSLALHLIIFLIIALPKLSVEDETERQLTMVEFTPVSKAADTPSTRPQPQPQPKPKPEPAPVPTPKPEPKPEPKPAEPVTVQEPVAPVPAQNPADVASVEQPDKPNTPVDSNTEGAPAPDNTDATEGDVDIATDNSTAASAESSIPDEDKAPDTGSNATDMPVEGHVPEDADSDSADDVSTETDPDTDANTETPTPEPELDGRVELPMPPQTFVSDRIQGEIEFAGKGRSLRKAPSAPDFKLSRNIQVSVKFKINSNGSTYDIVVPPLSSTELEQMLFNFVKGMQFSAVLYNEPDAATMKVHLKVR